MQKIFGILQVQTFEYNNTVHERLYRQCPIVLVASSRQNVKITFFKFLLTQRINN